MINGRTLRLALSGCRVPPGPLPVTEWVSVCPRCDRGLLQSTAGTPLPFLASDGVMRTALDYLEPGRPLPTPFGFARFAASSSALLSAFALFEEDDPTTVSVEDLGRKFADSPTPDVALSFSEAVCDWGRGRRVWANLLRHNGREELATTLVAWFKEALDSNDVERAIKQGIAIKGLSVSFASKHLRMLVPERFPVLDQVLSEGLGFALNLKGYALFQLMLVKFRDEIAATKSIAQLEGAIFLLVRQHVRSSANI